MIPIANPQIGAEELALIKKVLDSKMLATGSFVAELEQKFSSYIGVDHAIATSNGTAALHAAMLASGIKPGDEVIVPSFTFFATASSVMMCNARPVFVDIDYDTFNIDIEKIKEAITPKTRAIEPVHLYGLPCDMKAISDIAEDHNLLVIEDACQAHGAEYNGKKAGSMGDAGCFSFYPTKNMTTGEGGMITTNDPKIAGLARSIINHGQEGRYNHVRLGYNYRMTNVHAAIGLAQLKKLESFNKARIKNAAYFTKWLSKINGIKTPMVPKGMKHVFHQYTIKITREFGIGRNQVVEMLAKKGIVSSVYYPTPLHKQPVFSEYPAARCPVSEKAASEALSIPVYPLVSKSDAEKIVGAIKEISG